MDDVLVIYKESWLDGLAFDKWREELDAVERDDPFSEKRRITIILYKQLKGLLATLDEKSSNRLRRYIKGETQTSIANSEGVSQPAIYYNLHNSIKKLNWTKGDLHSFKKILIYGDLYVDL